MEQPECQVSIASKTVLAVLSLRIVLVELVKAVSNSALLIKSPPLLHTKLNRNFFRPAAKVVTANSRRQL